MLRPRHPHLPQDLVEEVLAWLPALTLIKFRCVSKSWRALIDSTEFRKLHLKRIRAWPFTEDHHKFLFWWAWPSPTETGKKEGRYYVSDFDSRDKMLKETMLEFSYPFQNQNDLGLSLKSSYGSCNGLVCLGYSDPLKHVHERVVILWNPYINKHWELPFYPLPHSEVRRTGVVVNGLEYDSLTLLAYGFGYDDTADDYKVVRWLELRNSHNEGDIPNYKEVVVYSLKSNCWTSLSQFPYSNPNRLVNCNGILVNCALHWMLKDKADLDIYILALDLRTNKCHRIPLPRELERQKFSRLKALDGCLCLLPNHNFDKRPSFEVWIMKDYGIQDSWTNLIIPLSTFHLETCRTSGVIPPLHPIAYSQRRTKLCFYSRHSVMWHDPVKGRWDWAYLVDSHSSIGRGFQFIGSLIDPSPSSCSSAGFQLK